MLLESGFGIVLSTVHEARAGMLRMHVGRCDRMTSPRAHDVIGTLLCRFVNDITASRRRVGDVCVQRRSNSINSFFCGPG